MPVPELSEIIFGAMRLDPSRTPLEDASRLISEMHSAGITSHHSSDEYESFDYYVDVLGKANISDLKHIVKVGVPHFDETCFSPASLERKVDRYLKRLNIECVEVVQWLVRSQPIDDEPRLKILEDQSDEIEAAFQGLKKKGKLNYVMSFPYSQAFGRRILTKSYCDGITDYLNPLETESLDYVRSMSETQWMVGIRPFAAGKLLREGETVPALKKQFNVKSSSELKRSLIRWALTEPKVLSTIVSIHSMEQLQELVECTPV